MRRRRKKRVEIPNENKDLESISKTLEEMKTKVQDRQIFKNFIEIS